MSEVNGQPLVWAFVDEAEPNTKPMTRSQFELAAQMFGQEAAEDLAQTYGLVENEPKAQAS